MADFTPRAGAERGTGSRGTRALLAVLVLAACGNAGAEPAVTAGAHATVRVYNASGIDAKLVRQALAAARPSLTSADVDVTWVPCDGTARCATPLKPGELVVRLVRAPQTGSRLPERFGGLLPLGDAFVDHAAGGVLATVYVDRVEALARLANASVPTLMGRAIAHELGHLLLSSRAHRKYGLMRAVWSIEEVSRSRSTDWAFTREDARAIHARRRAHTEEGNIVWGTE